MNAYLIKDVIANTTEHVLLTGLFDNLETEVKWLENITHQGGPLPRKFALQCKLNENGDQPLYRHPMDQFPEVVEFTYTINKIRKIIEDTLENKYQFNHAIIQEYRDGSDHITEHSDKTIDILQNSVIVNYSVGAPRVLKFRSKDPKEGTSSIYDIQDIELINDSMCVLDLQTNKLYKHSIRQNKAITEPRISITFRSVGTYYNKDTKFIYGQGAPKEGLNSLTKEEMLYAWSVENKNSEYTYDSLYGRGYNDLGIE